MIKQTFRAGRVAFALVASRRPGLGRSGALSSSSSCPGREPCARFGRRRRGRRGRGTSRRTKRFVSTSFFSFFDFFVPTAVERFRIIMSNVAVAVEIDSVRRPRTPPLAPRRHGSKCISVRRLSRVSRDPASESYSPPPRRPSPIRVR